MCISIVFFWKIRGYFLGQGLAMATGPNYLVHSQFSHGYIVHVPTRLPHNFQGFDPTFSRFPWLHRTWSHKVSQERFPQGCQGLVWISAVSKSFYFVSCILLFARLVGGVSQSCFPSVGEIFWVYSCPILDFSTTTRTSSIYLGLFSMFTCLRLMHFFSSIISQRTIVSVENVFLSI